MQMSKSEALDAVAQIKDLSKDFGFPNEQAKVKLIRLINQLRNDGPDDDYYREKLSNVEFFTDIGFSTKKFNKYQGGVSQVRCWVWGDIGIAEEIIEDRWPQV